MVKRDPKTNRNNIKICPRCKGNGYFKVKESVEQPQDTVVQCPMCKSEGEIHDPNDDIIINSSGMHRLQ
jgi:predicted Zn-ribbon and HTH transcriptional regulator